MRPSYGMNVGKENRKKPLNKIRPNDEEYSDWREMLDTGVREKEIASGAITVYFERQIDSLLTHIEASDVVVGCVAWLTHPEVLDLLSYKLVSIIVQKEDFLRPDLGSRKNWNRELRRMYERIPRKLERSSCKGTLLPKMSFASDPNIDPLRCVGNYNRDKKTAFPRMHNKFLVFGRYRRHVVEPYGVWTGSMNLTKNAVASFENALYIQDEKIVRAYYVEYGEIAALSEPLDWESEWVEPEWHIGT